MARIIKILNQLERQCVAIDEPFNQRSGATRHGFDYHGRGFAIGLALDVGSETLWAVGDALSALKACVSGGNESGR